MDGNQQIIEVPPLDQAPDSCPARSTAGARWRTGLRAGACAVADQAVVSGASFASSVMIGRACGREELGVSHLALTLLMLQLNSQAELIVAPYTVYRPRFSGQEQAAYSGSVLVHQLVLTVVGMLLLAIFVGSCASGFGPAEMIPSLTALLLALPCLLGQAFVRHVAFAAFRFGLALLLDAVVACLQLGGLLLLAWHGGLTVPAAFLVMGGASGVAVAFWLFLRPEPWRLRPERFWPDWLHNWRFGRWALASQIVGGSMSYLLPWMLLLEHGKGATGLLAACLKISGLGMVLLVGVANLLTPYAAQAWVRGGARGLQTVLRRTALLLATTLGPFCVLVCAVGESLVVSLFGPEFQGVQGIVTLLALSVLINSLAVTAGNGLWALDRPQANLLADLTGLAAALAVAAYGIPRYGVLGAASAMLASVTLGTSVRTFILARALGHAAARDAAPEGSLP